jgi:hypothetical protein
MTVQLSWYVSGCLVIMYSCLKYKIHTKKLQQAFTAHQRLLVKTIVRNKCLWQRLFVVQVTWTDQHLLGCYTMFTSQQLLIFHNDMLSPSSGFAVPWTTYQSPQCSCVIAEAVTHQPLTVKVNPRPVHMGLAMDKVAHEKAFLQVLWFSCQYHSPQCYISFISQSQFLYNLRIDSIIKQACKKPTWCNIPEDWNLYEEHWETPN